MVFRLALLLVPLISGCLWVSRNEFREAWDKDGDGWSIDEDCNDDNANIHPFAADWRGDLCDANCGTEPDADSDDWPDDVDCDDDNPDIYPCSTTEDGNVDVDCDGLPGVSREDDCEYAFPDPDYPEGEQGPIDAGDCADDGGGDTDGGDDTAEGEE
jgi:hypothetical protein